MSVVLTKTSLRFLFSATVSAALFTACSDDSSSNSRDDVGYESFEDLPKCDETLEGKAAMVDSSYYRCSMGIWSKLDHFANGVCNIEVCDGQTDNEYAYVISSEKVYQCHEGVWIDENGKTFSDKEYIDCFKNALVAISVEGVDSLKTCTSKLDGEMASVSGKLYACTAKEWKRLKDQVVSERDLPKCSTNGDHVYVLNKMKAYSCKDGLWYKDGKAVQPIVGSSSSAAQSSPSTAPFTADKTPVRGICIPSEKETEKGTAVTWTFYNMGGTPVSYAWDFGKNASSATSSNASPTVNFKRGGVYSPKLIINGGLESESEEIVCSGVWVRGTPVENCKCTTDAETLKASEYSPASATWAVSGCIGEAPFTYEWAGGAEGSKNFAEAVTTDLGEFAPSVTVYNSDGESMQPTCQSVSVEGYITADCYIDDEGYFNVSRLKNVPSYTLSLDVVLSSDEGSSKKETLEERYGEGYPYYWEYENSFALSLPEVSKAGIHQYTLTQGGETVCRAVNASCGPVDNSVTVGQTSTWNVLGVGDYTAKSYSWKFSRNYWDEEIYEEVKELLATSDEKMPELSFAKTGYVYATLVLDEGLPTEISMTCRGQDVNPREVVGCECGDPVLLSESADLAEVDEVVYQWTVTGCSSEGAEPLTYSWYNGIQDEKDPATVTVSTSRRGYVSPDGQIYNKDGNYAYSYCSGVDVEDSRYKYVSLSSGEELGPGFYIVKDCDGYGGGYVVWREVQVSSEGFESWFSSDIYHYGEEYGEGFDEGTYGVDLPVEIVIPEGESLTVGSCKYFW